jgi:hypothetical protein
MASENPSQLRMEERSDKIAGEVQRAQHKMRQYQYKAMQKATKCHKFSTSSLVVEADVAHCAQHQRVVRKDQVHVHPSP